ncbi:MAG: hypothetical protein RLZZ183_1056 [Actinomycetota bacterium]|jgi:hypothetical protein
MVSSQALTVEKYLKELPLDRKETVIKIRNTILKNLPKGYKEVMEFGMICYVIPLSKYPDTYNKKPLVYCALANQKNYISLYLSCVYVDKKTRKDFEDSYKKSGKKLNAGASCIRFKKLEEVPFDVVNKAIKKFSVNKFIEIYETSRKK